MVQHSLDPRSPWVVGIHELMRRPGEMKSLNREIPAPAALGVGMIRVPEGSPIDIHLRLESVNEGVLATGVVSADLVGECARCLGEVSDHRDFDLQELQLHLITISGHLDETDDEFTLSWNS